MPASDHSPQQKAGIVDALVQRARDGDHRAFALLYDAHAPRVYALSLRLCGNADDAAEVTQDTFVCVWQRLSTFKFESDFGTWVHRIAVNSALERLRTDRRREARVTTAPLLELVSFAHADEPLDRRMDLQQALAQLGHVARTVFVLREIEGYPYAELSTLFSMTEEALRAQVYRARKSIMEMLERTA
ncbi:MAG: RNA polymerase sigma factor [Gemmatimonadaceae bacterium]